MFSKKKYFEVNREERHFGFLLFSEILNNDEFRNRFFCSVNEKKKCNLNPDSFEVYSEVAALRDYWFNLGDSIKYDESTHQKRFEVLTQILSSIGYSDLDIETNDVFWTTKNPETRKLWCPSSWNIKEIEALKRKGKDLAPIRWCFNAKPDLMIDSPDCCVFIELKVESGIGRNQFGYDQKDTQEKISKMMKQLIPLYSNSQFFNTSLELETKDGITWREVIEILNACHRDNAAYNKVQNSLKQILLRYYNK